MGSAREHGISGMQVRKRKDMPLRYADRNENTAIRNLLLQQKKEDVRKREEWTR